MPDANIWRYDDKLKIVDGAATDTTGVKLTYTVPSGVRGARVTHVSWFNNTGAPTVQLEIVRGASVIVFRSDTASYQMASGIMLEAGDIIRFNVTVAGAASSTADATISALELAA